MLLNDLRPDISNMINRPKAVQKAMQILHRLVANVDRIKVEANPLIRNKNKYD